MSAVDFEYCKDEAIAFGEWLAKEQWEGRNWHDEPYGDKSRRLPLPYWVREEGHNLAGFNYPEKTTEELYDSFLKSREK